ncbi:MAG: IclR family transcriptional regulator [Proteobacteria bacterium]|nr:IclR family transcriptional regulator [Pseudomonadota bacterium]
MESINPKGFKRVPAIDKCFTLLDLLVKSKEPMGISDISGRLGINKSTVFNISHTLVDLDVLENSRNGKFTFGTRFYILANMAGKRSTLLQLVRPYLEHISEKTNLSVFLGLRSDCQAILIDKIDSAHGIKVSSEIGTQMPILAGAGIKAMLSQLSDEVIDEILARTELKRYTPLSIVDKDVYKEEILEVRKQGIAFDIGEYIDGMVGFAVPVKTYGNNVQAAIWAAGLVDQVPDSSRLWLISLMKKICEDINCRLQ